MPRKIPFLLLVGLFALPLAACGENSASSSAEASPSTSIAVVSDPATIGAYDPPSATVTAGQTVQWTFRDKNPHSVSSDGGSFHSAQLADGKTFRHRFDKAGSYPYHCSIHPEMHGTVVVG